MEAILTDIQGALMSGNAPGVSELVQKALDDGLAPGAILEEGLVASMRVIGQKFKADEIFMPEVMIAARAMNAGLAVLDPILAKSDHEPKGTLILATVKSDLHDVGKNMVSMMFRGGGYRIVDLGVDVPPERIIEAINNEKADLVGLSALLTMTLPQMQATIEAIEEAGLKDRVIVMVGGAPVTEEFARRIGAHGWAADAASAVEKADELLAGRGGRHD